MELRIIRKDWKPGAVVSFHVRNHLLAKIESVLGNTLILDREANFTAEHSIVLHHDQFALQTCLDRAVSERKAMRIPSGRFRLSTGLWVRDSSAVIEGAGTEFTTIDVSGAHTSAFWGGGGREFVLRRLSVVGNAGFEILPTNRPFITDSGFAFWPTANQQMETFGSAALNIVSTEFILCEDLAVSQMASEAFYLHGSDRGGKRPFIQAPHEGMESVRKQYTKQCVFRRCRVSDCGFNAFNNNDFAENTIISGCHVENVGAPKSAAFITDHPHRRGENSPSAGRAGRCCGSSPQAWGKRYYPRRENESKRIIPTGVGKTHSRAQGAEGGSDHPHRRGENATPNSRSRRWFGSSPQARGKRYGVLTIVTTNRIIPTGVGKTSTLPRRPRIDADHPHRRGENGI